MSVKAWKEKVVIPTCMVGRADKNPVFGESMAAENASPKSYPYANTESTNTDFIAREWEGWYLENEYLKVLILPELGGRVQMAYDKIRERYFIHAPKELGTIIDHKNGSAFHGGITFHWPQYPRPALLESMQVQQENNKDGSITIWCSQIELVNGLKGMSGFTLYADQAYLEVKNKIYNRTRLPQSFNWWAAATFKMSSDYQPVFPPDSQATIPENSLSTFAIEKSEYNFLGCYEKQQQVGMLQLANHYQSIGKQQQVLTSLEGIDHGLLMSGFFSSTTNDHAWLMPFEERSFEQYFLPYINLGEVKNARKSALVNLDFTDELVLIKLYTTAVYKNINVLLLADDTVLFDGQVDASPYASFEESIPIDKSIAQEDYHLIVSAENGEILVDYQPQLDSKDRSPKPTEILPPSAINTVEELFLQGQHIEQNHLLQYDPRLYYEAALKKAPQDSRCNNALGLWLFRQGVFAEAESYFHKAIDGLSSFNQHPFQGAVYYNLGLCLKFLYRSEEAYAAFYKATWNAAWQGAAYFCLAEIATEEEEYAEALSLVEKALLSNWHNHKARALKINLLGRLNKLTIARKFAKKSLKLDPFNVNALFEKYLLGRKKAMKKIRGLLKDNIQDYIAYALDYANAGCLLEAMALLEKGIKTCPAHPMAFYYLGWFAAQIEHEAKARIYFDRARITRPDRCFPNRLEAILALETAVHYHPDDDRALYYLGNLWYDKKNYDQAINCWKKSRAMNATFPTIFRNLALAFYNQKGQAKAAVASLEKSFELDPSDARVLMELDQLYKRLNHKFAKRLKLLTKHEILIQQRDDLFLEKIRLLQTAGRYSEALHLLAGRKIQYSKLEKAFCEENTKIHLLRAQGHYQKGHYKNALETLFAINPNQKKPNDAMAKEILFWKGMIYEKLSAEQIAVACWQKASLTIDELPSINRPQKAIELFYQILALTKIKEDEKAQHLFTKMTIWETEHIDANLEINAYATTKIWKNDPEQFHKVQTFLIQGLGALGLKQYATATSFFEQILTIENSQNSVRNILQLCQEEVL